jgi:integrase
LQTGGMAFKVAAYSYLDYAEKRFAPKTYDGKRRTLAGLSAHLGDGFPLDQVRPVHIDEYLGKQTKSANTYNAYRKEISAFFSYARRVLKIIEINPCWDLDKLPYTPKRKQIPSEDEVLKMIMASDPETERPLLLTVLHTLGRIDEVLRLDWQDVNFKQRAVTLWTRKRKGGILEADALHMNQDLYDVLSQVWKRKKQNKWVFLNPKTDTRYTRRPKMMAAICRRAGIAPLGKGRRKIRGKMREVDLHYGFHALRHFMASYLNDTEKAGTKTLQRLLRHKSQRTTEIYLHEIDNAQKAVLEAIEGKFTVVGDGCGSDQKPQHGAATTAMPGSII